MKTKPLDNFLAPKVGLSFYVLAFKDYLGARVLLDHALLLQGATLASTAVEKYLKALLAARGLQTRGHLSDWDMTSLAALARDKGLNEDFLALLRIVYEIRYLDNLKQPVSFSIERSKFLAELDRTVAVLNGAVEFQRGADLVNPYETAKATALPELMHENWVLAGGDQQTLAGRPDVAEAFYIDLSLEVLSCVIQGCLPRDFHSFTAPGIVRVGPGYKCTLVD